MARPLSLDQKTGGAVPPSLTAAALAVFSSMHPQSPAAAAAPPPKFTAPLPRDPRTNNNNQQELEKQKQADDERKRRQQEEAKKKQAEDARRRKEEEDRKKKEKEKKEEEERKAKEKEKEKEKKRRDQEAEDAHRKKKEKEKEDERRKSKDKEKKREQEDKKKDQKGDTKASAVDGFEGKPQEKEIFERLQKAMTICVAEHWTYSYDHLFSEVMKVLAEVDLAADFLSPSTKRLATQLGYQWRTQHRLSHDSRPVLFSCVLPSPSPDIPAMGFAFVTNKDFWAMCVFACCVVISFAGATSTTFPAPSGVKSLVTGSSMSTACLLDSSGSTWLSTRVSMPSAGSTTPSTSSLSAIRT